MLATSKRRASLYTLPLVVVIGFLAVAGLAAWQRSDVIADLADQVAYGEKAESTAAVRQLAAIPNPPLSILVEAAASDEHATAEAAQVAINRMLGQWQRQVDKKQRIGTIAAQVTELAAALAAQRQAFPPADYSWLASTTRKIVRLANKCPAKKTPMVALHCDEIMSVVGRNTPESAPVAGRAEPVDEAQKKDGAVPAQETDSRESRQVRLEREFSEFPSQAVTTGMEPSAPVSVSNNPAPFQPPSADDAGPRAKADKQVDGAQPPGKSQSESGSMGRTTLPDITGRKPDWSQPIFRILPVAPSAAAADDQSLAGSEAKAQAAAVGEDTAAAETRALLERWYGASVNDRFELEEDLAARGFRRLPTRLVKQYLSENVADRLRVLDSALTEPNVDARPWLLLLAEDENADVRLMAVTVMATSDDKTLVEAAWQAAIRDRDPRIADLAARLRERRR